MSRYRPREDDRRAEPAAGTHLNATRADASSWCAQVAQYEQGGDGVRGDDLSALDQVRDVFERFPLATCGFEVVLGVAHIVRAPGPVDVVDGVGQAVLRLHRDQVLQRTRAPSGLLQQLPDESDTSVPYRWSGFPLIMCAMSGCPTTSPAYSTEGPRVRTGD